MNQKQILKYYQKTSNKKCPICNQDVTMYDISTLNMECTVTKRKGFVIAHRNCIRRD